MSQTAERPLPATRRPRFVGELDTLIRARYPLVYLVSSEEVRVEELLRGIARGHGKSLIGWSAIRGLHRLDETRGVDLPDGTEDPLQAMAGAPRAPGAGAGGAQGPPRPGSTTGGWCARSASSARA